jgi:hypothetical protein
MGIDTAGSVTFTATTIAPDFHLIAVLLAIGIIPTIAVVRYRWRLI